MFLNASLFVPVWELELEFWNDPLGDEDLLFAQTLLTFHEACTFLEVGKGATGVENPDRV